MLFRSRFCAINDNARATAAEVGAMLMDGNDVEVFYDSRLLAPDRLHLNADGHRRVAAAVLERLGLPHDSDWRDPLPLLRPRPAPLRWAGTAAWALVFLGPWLLRRLTGRSSGDGRVAKYVAPVRWPR